MNASQNTIYPDLPDDLVDRIAQLVHAADVPQRALGDELVVQVDELGPKYATLPEFGSIRRARTFILRRLAQRVGTSESTLRDRESICRFFTAQDGDDWSIFSFSQMRALKSAGARWREYAEWASLPLPAPVAAIRDEIKRNGDQVQERPAWQRMLDKFIDIACSLERDEAAPAWVRQAAHFVVEASRDWRQNV